MLSYLKIEIFAYELFNTVWLKAGLISHMHDPREIYTDECLAEIDFEVACDKLFYDAVLCRRILFHQVYMEELLKEKDRYWNSPTDFLSYMHAICERYDWFGCLNVFERVFATCAFAINLCFCNRENENVDIIKQGYVFWSIYFDEFTEEFYEQGGWYELKRAASLHTSPLVFLQMCFQTSENILHDVTEAIQNYNTLKETSIIQECETVSKLWVKSRIESLCSSFDLPIEFAGYENCSHAEHILNELKRLCYPCALDTSDLQYDEECSQRTVFDAASFYIPLTPTGSEESTSSSSSFNGMVNVPDRLGEDVSISSSSGWGDISETDNSDFVNESSSNEHEDSSYSNSSDDVSCDCLHILGPPIQFETICLISDCEDQYLSRRMNKMHLNHDTIELEESDVSETDLCSNKNIADFDLNTKDQILVPQKETTNQCEMLEDLSNAVESVSNDIFPNSSSDTESKPCYNQQFNEDEFVRGTVLSNTPALNDDTLSISEWDENDLIKNISTPIKRNKS